MENLPIIVVIHTFSLDSKAAAMLIKYFTDPQKVRVHFMFSTHGIPLDESKMPVLEGNNILIANCGVNLSSYGKYENCIALEIPLDGKRSACNYIYSAKNVAPFIGGDNEIISILNVFPNYIEKWVKLIKQFQVRTSSFVSDEVKAFNYAAGQFDTFPRNNSISYFWDKLIKEPDYLDIVIKSGMEIVEYKQQQYKELQGSISAVEINGHKCLLLNKRDADSSVFELHPEIDTVDYLITYQDKFKKNEYDIVDCKPKGNLLEYVNRIPGYVLNKNAITVFTVYRNAEMSVQMEATVEDGEERISMKEAKKLSAVEFTKHWGGKGHDGVATFEVKLPTELISWRGMSRLYRKQDVSGFTASVRKFIGKEAQFILKGGCLLHDNVPTKILMLNNASALPYPYLDHIGDVLVYHYNNLGVGELLNSFPNFNKNQNRNRKISVKNIPKDIDVEDISIKS